MKVHIYASYKRSPVGFQLGSFSFVKNQTDNYVLKYWQESKLIYDLFEQNFIVQASGRLPHSNKFIHLVKNLEYTYTNRDDFGKIVYIKVVIMYTPMVIICTYTIFIHHLLKCWRSFNQ